jgi:serine/threonine protein kinase
MAAWNPQANDIFLKAIEIRSLDERRAFVDQACGGDSSLRGEVAALLTAHDQAGSFLDRPASALTCNYQGPEAPALDDALGKQIGAYKLLQKLGEGGMGAVYLAEQSRPVQRKVALKIIKAGMDSRQVIARFEAERQALAVMDHPNIAKVLDAGATGEPGGVSTGKPYLSPSTAIRNTSRPRNVWSCSFPSARPCSTPIRKASSTAISNRRMCWWGCTTASRFRK